MGKASFNENQLLSWPRQLIDFHENDFRLIGSQNNQSIRRCSFTGWTQIRSDFFCWSYDLERWLVNPLSTVVWCHLSSPTEPRKHQIHRALQFRRPVGSALRAEPTFFDSVSGLSQTGCPITSPALHQFEGHHFLAIPNWHKILSVKFPFCLYRSFFWCVVPQTCKICFPQWTMCGLQVPKGHSAQKNEFRVWLLAPHLWMVDISLCEGW